MLSLTKENFWNELMAKYPDEMKEFCDWIDEYKKKVNWKSLFNSGEPMCSNSSGCGGSEKDSPKYHDLPIAMQIGIFLQFVQECGGNLDFDIIMDKGDFGFTSDFNDIPDHISNFFYRRNRKKKWHRH